MGRYGTAVPGPNLDAAMSLHPRFPPFLANRSATLAVWIIGWKYSF